jgi:hypothetical protein
MRSPRTSLADLGLLWIVGVSLPFDWQWSKNRIWAARAGSYARRLQPQAKARREALTLVLRAELNKKGIRPVVAPLWLAIHVEIPDRRGDALNVLDLVADGVQDATGVNDRWFQLGGLTWSLNREHPALHIAVGQDTAQPAKRSRSKPPPPEPEPDPRRPPPWST